MLQDLPLRVIPPWGAALLTGVATVAIVFLILEPAALVLGATLLLAATVVPVLTRHLARRSEAGRATAGGRLSVEVVDLLEGAPDLTAYGAIDAQLARVAEADAALTRHAAAASATTGVGSGAVALLGGLAVWGAAVVGVPAVRSGRMSGTFLAVVVLVPLAAFELVAGLPPAAQAFERVRRSAARIFELADAPSPVTEPADPVRPTAGATELHREACGPATGPARGFSTASTSNSVRAAASRSSAPAAPARPRSPRSSSASCPTRARSASTGSSSTGWRATTSAG